MLAQLKEMDEAVQGKNNLATLYIFICVHMYIYNSVLHCCYLLPNLLMKHKGMNCDTKRQVECDLQASRGLTSNFVNSERMTSEMDMNVTEHNR